MSATLRIRDLRIWRLAIPMRLRFEHAAAARNVADPVLVRLGAEAPYADLCGFGETLARRYVTGESAESVCDDIVQFFAPALLDFRAESFAEALEAIETLPALADGRLVNAARAAVELALIDLSGRAFFRRAADVAGWLDLDRAASGTPDPPPYSGIVAGRTRAKSAMLVRAQRWYGLRDFKLKVAVPGWEQRLEWAGAALARAIRSGRATLRVDANGGWSLRQASDAIALLKQHGVEALEQPLSRANDAGCAELLRAGGLRIIADESLLTLEDADRLIETESANVFNVRIAKNGGLLPALRIAARALAAGRDVQLGCLVGETSVLTAAGRAFLELCPQARYAEGAFGRFLLKADVTRRPLTFGYGGRLARRSGWGHGVDVDEALVQRLAATPVIDVQF